MKTTHRAYDDVLGDFKRLANFILDHNEDIRTYSTWCIGRFVDWKYGLYPSKTAVPDFCGSNAHLWFDGFSRLAGFVISEYGGPEFAIITLAGYRFLFEEMLAWALANWGDRGPALEIEIRKRQALETAVLERHGFQQKAEFFTQALDLRQKLPPRLPLDEGFSIVDMGAHPDYRAQRILRAEAFDGRSDLSEEELQRATLFYGHTRQGPIYHAQADLCVMAADGRFVSGCEALIDARNGEADVERVCTHSDFRRRGFARALIQECLFRLQEMGLHKAYIAGYSPQAISLYASIGQSETTTNLIFKQTGRS
jgi:ribosomal protein S18 acetylase RimI-like enzyme